MRLHWSLAVALSLVFAVEGFGQGNEGFLDVMVARVKPEKRAEFDNVIKKMVEANRKNNGDPWIAAETAIGEWNTIYFTSTRANYAGMEKAMDAFFGALMKSYGPDGAMKLFQDFNNCIVSARSEIRQRRGDLSRNVPADPAALMKLVGESRLLRVVIVRVRPGRTAEYVERLRTNNEALKKAGSKTPVSVTQAVNGQSGTVFYITTLLKSLADMDNPGPALRQALGEEDYRQYAKTTQEVVLGTETIVNRFVPELSNPPSETVAVAPDFWRPKPPMPAKPKTATEGKKQ